MEATTIEAVDRKVTSPLPNLERRYVSFVLNLFTKRSTLGVTVVATNSELQSLFVFGFSQQ
jgi:hypothetical protein